MRVAIVGAGINGACVAWELAKASHEVTVFEKDRAMAHTSSASSKLLHGGLRYLETAQFRLVREALQERGAWLEDAPELARPMQLTLPIYRRARNGRWIMGLGLTLYDLLASGSGLPCHGWMTARTAIDQDPHLRPEGLVGAFQFWDACMDDTRLGLWVMGQATQAGALLQEGWSVTKVTRDGCVCLHDGAVLRFDRVILAAGPWTAQLLDHSGIPTRYRLDLVRGSHIVLDRPTRAAYFLEVPGDPRIFFVLPWQGQTLVGTTEVRQESPERPQPSEEEIHYLLTAYNAYRKEPATAANIRHAFAGVRPLIKSAINPTRASREYVIEQQGQLLTLLGGKWTTARALARKVRTTLENT